MAFGRGSRTTAITSIASSLLIRSLKFLAFTFWLSAEAKNKAKSSLGQNHRTVFGYGYTMLEVRAEAAIGRNGGPLVAQHSRLRLAKIHHRLNGDDHAFPQLRAVSSRSVIRHLRLFMQMRADSVPNKFAHHAKACGFYVFLYRRSHVADRIPDSRLIDSPIE